MFYIFPIWGNDPIRLIFFATRLVILRMSMEEPMNKGFLRDKWYLIRPFVLLKLKSQGSTRWAPEPIVVNGVITITPINGRK